jgi:hypothetical protein
MFNKWLNNEVYGYIIKSKDDIIDSCYGFYNKEDAIEMAEEKIKELKNVM